MDAVASCGEEQHDKTATVTATSEIETVYRQHGTRLWRAVFAYAQDRHVADDAVAEAFAQALGGGAPSTHPRNGCGGRLSGSPPGVCRSDGDLRPCVSAPSVRNPEPAWELLAALRRASATDNGRVWSSTTTADTTPPRSPGWSAPRRRRSGCN